MKRLVARALFELSMSALGATWAVRDLHMQAKQELKRTQDAYRWARFWGGAMVGKDL